MDYFIYDGVDSRDFGLYVMNDKNLKLNLSPPKRSYTETVNGIDGKLLFGQDYETRSIHLKCYLTDSSETNLRTIMSWLGGLNERQLILSYEAYKIYTGTFENQVELNIYSNKGLFELEFQLYSPLAKSRFTTLETANIVYGGGYSYGGGWVYGSTSDDYTFNDITVSTDIEIYHGGNVNKALPIITVEGSADDITFKQYTDSTKTEVYKEFSYGSFNGTLVINSEVYNTFLNGTLDNSSFEGRYLQLFGKTNWDVKGSGNIISGSGLYITLDDRASDVDDYYNNEVVFIGLGEQEIINRKIIDYDGNTKTATLEYALNSDLTINYRYSIYSVASGINYININGTNLNLTSVKFDFNYIYL